MFAVLKGSDNEHLSKGFHTLFKFILWLQLERLWSEICRIMLKFVLGSGYKLYTVHVHMNINKDMRCLNVSFSSS